MQTSKQPDKADLQAGKQADLTLKRFYDDIGPPSGPTPPHRKTDRQKNRKTERQKE